MSPLSENELFQLRHLPEGMCGADVVTHAEGGKTLGEKAAEEIVSLRGSVLIPRKIYVLLASGKFTDMINGTPMTGDRVELIKAFTDYQTALSLLQSKEPPDVKEPEKWGVTSIGIYEVELKTEP